MNVHQVVPFNQIVARRSADLHQAHKCRNCLSSHNLRAIYTGGDLFRQQLIEQYSTSLLGAHELPRFICESCEIGIIHFQSMLAKREQAENQMQSFVYGGGPWPEAQEMEVSDEDSDSDTDSETESESETLVDQRVHPVIKVEADSTTKNVPDAVLRSRVEHQEHRSSVQEDPDNPLDRSLDEIIPPLADHQADVNSYESDDDIELINEYNLNPY